MIRFLSNTTSNVMYNIFSRGSSIPDKVDEFAYLKPGYISSDEADHRIRMEIHKFTKLTKNLKDLTKGLAIEGASLAAWWKGYAPFWVAVPVSVVTYYYFLQQTDYTHLKSEYFEQLKKLYQIYTLCGKNFTAESAKNPVMQELLESLYGVVEYRYLRYVWSKDSINPALLPKDFLKILGQLPHKIDPELKGNGIVDNSFFGIGQQFASSVYLRMCGLDSIDAEDIIKNVYGVDSKEAELILAEVNKLKLTAQAKKPISNYINNMVAEGYAYVSTTKI